MPGAAMTDFASRLVAATRAIGPLCVGIDPHPGRVPALFGGDTPDGLARWPGAPVFSSRRSACSNASARMACAPCSGSAMPPEPQA